MSLTDAKIQELAYRYIKSWDGDIRPFAHAIEKEVTHKPPAIPEGYVLVPKEPTETMCDAGWNCYDKNNDCSVGDIYKDMITAAQGGKE